MLRTIIVDDEKKAITRLERLIQQEGTLSLAGSFTLPRDAMDFIADQDVDIVFLDIEMPDMNGLELSESLFEKKPDIDVVFVTAYDKYALRAFQAHGIGYLLKPVSLEDVKKQIAAILKRRQAKLPGPAPREMAVQCLGHFLCFPRGTQHEHLQWKTSKSEELFAFLLHYGGRPVSKEKIIDTLWPDMDILKASQNLHATSWYIRDTLRGQGFPGLFIRSKGGYQLRLDGLQCDLLEFTRLLTRLQTGVESVDIMEKACRLYKGAYLEDKLYEWTGGMRAWLDSEHEKIQFRLAALHTAAADTKQAMEIYYRIIRHNPLAEAAYTALIELSLRDGDKTGAVLLYKKYRTMLREEFGFDPPETLRTMMEPLL